MGGGNGLRDGVAFERRAGEVAASDGGDRSMAAAHLSQWQSCVIAPAIPSPKGGPYEGVIMCAKKGAIASPTAMTTNSIEASTHVSPHRDVCF